MIDLHRQRQVSAGKNEKMEALYDYLTSPQFAQKFTAVFESFKRMRDELESEKNQTTQRWARREKPLQVGMNQLLGIGGEIQGLSQQELPVLELEAPLQATTNDNEAFSRLKIDAQLKDEVWEITNPKCCAVRVPTSGRVPGGLCPV